MLGKNSFHWENGVSWVASTNKQSFASLAKDRHKDIIRLISYSCSFDNVCTMYRRAFRDVVGARGFDHEAAVTVEQALLLFLLFSVIMILPGGVEPRLLFFVTHMYSPSPSHPEPAKLLEQTHARPPFVVGNGLGVHDDLIRKGVRVGSGDGRDVVFVAVHDGDDLVCGFL